MAHMPAMQSAPRILSLSTRVPPLMVDRRAVIALARRVFGASADEMMGIYVNAGIERRHSVVPLDWLEQPHGWAERNRLFAEHAVELGASAALACLARAGLPVAAVDAVVAVSSSGVCTPALDALLMERLGTRPDVTRLPLFGLGCAGGALGLARAATLAQSMPGARVLLVVVELCGLTFRPQDHSKANVVATALFGDGAAAALLSTEGDGPRLTAWGEHTWPHSLDVMGWRIEDDGFGVLFSRDIPELIHERFRAALDGWLDRVGLNVSRLDGFVCHPGGAKVIGALEEVLGLPSGRLVHERELLRDYGNMSAATLLFVLERALAAPPLPRRSLLTALGPGFTAGFLVMEPP